MHSSLVPGLTMYLVYGRTTRRGAGKAGKRRGGSPGKVAIGETAPVPDAAPLPAGRP